jgi:predicted NAD/FAD-binding protein
MAAAWLVASRYPVTVYERELQVGGHTHTVDVKTSRGMVPVDTGFIVYNEPNYPNLTALFAHLDVATKASDMGFSVSLDNGALEYAGSLTGLVAQPANLLRSDFLRMLRDTLRFYRDADGLIGQAPVRSTLGEYLADNNYSEAFARLHLLPMGAAIWSSSLDDMRAYPMAAFARFFANHGLLKLLGRPQWRTVVSGSREYAKKLTARYTKNIRINCGAKVILRGAEGVTIVDQRGNSDRYDGVIVATHADQALAMLGDPSVEETNLLGSFKYRPNKVVLHSDTTFMPKRKMAWSSWNYMGRSDQNDREDLCVTYWMNKLQGIDKRTPIFVTLNPASMPRDETIYGAYNCAHPLFNERAIAAQHRLWRLQGSRATWFCGSYFGSGFHEDALQAGLAAAEDATGLRRPWRVAEESSRISIIPKPVRTAA